MAPPEDGRFIAIALVVPWAILLCFTEANKDFRMFGVWPLQIILIAAFAVACAARLPRASIRRWVFLAMVAAMVGGNLTVLERVRNWQRGRWSAPGPAWSRCPRTRT